MATKLQQYQISGSFGNDISDKVEQSAFLKENRTLIDDLNSLRTQVKNILGESSWTAEQLVSLHELNTKLGLNPETNNIAIEGDLTMYGQSYFKGAVQVQSLSENHVVLVGKDGELQQSDQFTYYNDLGLIKLGGAPNVVSQVELYNGDAPDPGVQIKGDGTMQLGSSGIGHGRIVAANGNGPSNVIISAGPFESMIEIGGVLDGKPTARLNGYGLLELGGSGQLAGGVMMRDADGVLKVDINPLSWKLSDQDGNEAFSLENTGQALFRESVVIGSNVPGSLAIRNESGDEKVMMTSVLSTFKTGVRIEGPTNIIGDLTVSGTTTTIDSQNLLVEDPVVVLGKGFTSAAWQPVGVVLNGATVNGRGIFIGTDTATANAAERIVFASGDYGDNGTVDFADTTPGTCVSLVAHGMEFRDAMVDGTNGYGDLIGRSYAVDDYNTLRGVKLRSYEQLSFESHSIPVDLVKDYDQWTQFHDQFGSDATLIGALVAASGGASSGANQKVQRKGSFLAGSNTFNYTAEMNGKKLRTDSYDTAIRDLDVYLNGMLLTLAHPDNLVEGDYSLVGQGDITFNFTVTDDDVITVVLRNAVTAPAVPA